MLSSIQSQSNHIPGFANYQKKVSEFMQKRKSKNNLLKLSNEKELLNYAILKLRSYISPNSKNSTLQNFDESIEINPILTDKSSHHIIRTLNGGPRLNSGRFATNGNSELMRSIVSNNDENSMRNGKLNFTSGNHDHSDMNLDEITEKSRAVPMKSLHSQSEKLIYLKSKFSVNEASPKFSHQQQIKSFKIFQQCNKTCVVNLKPNYRKNNLNKEPLSLILVNSESLRKKSYVKKDNNPIVSLKSSSANLMNKMHKDTPYLFISKKQNKHPGILSLVHSEYPQLFKGKLDQKARQFEVTGAKFKFDRKEVISQMKQVIRTSKKRVKSILEQLKRKQHDNDQYLKSYGSTLKVILLKKSQQSKENALLS